jgi:hypothetical protein
MQADGRVAVSPRFKVLGMSSGAEHDCRESNCDGSDMAHETPEYHERYRLGESNPSRATSSSVMANVVAQRELCRIIQHLESGIIPTDDKCGYCSFVIAGRMGCIGLRSNCFASRRW